MIKINYNEKSLKSILWFGIYSIVIGVLMFILKLFTDTVKIPLIPLSIGFIGGGFFKIFMYYFQKRKQYLTIDNNILIKNSLIKKEINLNDIIEIEKFGGYYTLKNEKLKFIINTYLIDSKSLEELNNELEKFILKNQVKVTNTLNRK